MSYASVAARDAPPLDEQPKPDPSLLEGRPRENSSKEATRESNEEASTKQSNTEKPSESDGAPRGERDPKTKLSRKSSDITSGPVKRSRKDVDPKPQEPTAKLTCMNVINVTAMIAVAIASFKAWDKPRWDRRVVGGVIIGLGALLGSQGYLGALMYKQKKRA